jgi:undecaprenyl-diphosphatase
VNRLPLVIAAACAGFYILLGDLVSAWPPTAIDRAGHVFVREAPQLAVLFTRSCLWYVLVVFGAAAIALAIARPDWRARAIFSVVVTLVGWQTSDVLKLVFKRPRPDYSYLIHEPTFSYSSGHAMFAVVVYGLWSVFVARSSLPRSVRIPLSAALAQWACGVIWSRLALGAHYVTDLIGGVLLGIVMLAIGAAVAFAWPARQRTGTLR